MTSALECAWLPPPAGLALAGDKVHVWGASLDRPARRVKDLQCMLATDELNRAASFRFEKDRQRFVVARGLLRAILGRYLDVDPGQLRFCVSDYGKLSLAPASGQTTLSFNLSYSDGLALYAIARGREVGIDVERVRPIAEASQIVERFFSASEKAAFRTLPENLRQEAFFACWTRKEAYVKARGKGLLLSLDQFDVPLISGEPADLLRVRGDAREEMQFSLRNLAPGAGYAAAVAAEGDDWQLACWQFPWPGVRYSGEYDPLPLNTPARVRCG